MWSGMSSRADDVSCEHMAAANNGRSPISGRVCAQVEDRPQVKERVERYVEHVPVEKQYVVETRPAGEVEKARVGCCPVHWL